MSGPPVKQGLYDPANEHDACGVGFVVNIRGEKSHEIVRSGLEILVNLTHRGACGCDPETGDGAGDSDRRFPTISSTPRPRSWGLSCRRRVSSASAPSSCRETAPRASIANSGWKRSSPRKARRCLGWRDVPIDSRVLGRSPAPSSPSFARFSLPAATTPARHAGVEAVRDPQTARDRNPPQLAGQKQYCYVPSCPRE